MGQRTKKVLAAGVTVGYVLGRTGKGRAALTVAALVVGRSADPRTLVAQGVRKLARSPRVAALGEQLRGEVFQAGRTAFGAAANRRLGSLTDALVDRTPSREQDVEDTEAEPEPADSEEPEAGSGRSRTRPTASGSGRSRPQRRTTGPARSDHRGGPTKKSVQSTSRKKPGAARATSRRSDERGK
jgi:hypothetical protein